MLTKEDFQMISKIVKDEVAPINHRLDRVEHRIGNIENRVTNIENHVTNIEKRVTSIEKRVTNMECRVGNVEESLEETRTATNRLLDWAERVYDVIGVRV